jgi:hypothetical protein
MRKSLNTVLKWLASWRGHGVQPEAGPTSPLPEHERRLRELEKSGRTLFFP